MVFDAVFNRSFFDSYDKQNSEVFVFGENEQLERVLTERNIEFTKVNTRNIKGYASTKKNLYCLYDTLSDSDKKEMGSYLS